MMIPLKHKLGFVVIVILARYGQTSAEPLKVPDVAGYIKKSDWVHAKIELTTRINNLTSLAADNTWLVEEYFTLEPAIAVAYYQNVKAKIHYVLVAYDGRFYYSMHEESTSLTCKPDQRQDFFAIYPWRYMSSDASGEKVYALHGLGAIWMNAIRSRVACEMRAGLLCSHVDKHLTFTLKFDGQGRWPTDVLVERRYIMHEDRLTLLDHFQAELKVNSIEVIKPVARRDLKRIDDLVKTCDRAKLDAPTFPSLIRSMGESMQKNYHLSYAVTLYNTPDTPEKNLYIDEWFSYTEKQQSILVSDGGYTHKHQFHRLFGLKNNHLCINYKVEWLYNDAVDCHFEEFDENILTNQPMSKRSIRFVDHELSGRPYDGNFDGNKRFILGLGALLMNMYDSRSKHLVPVDDDQETGESGADANEWIVDDSERSGLRYHLFFRRPLVGDRNSCYLNSLLRVEIRKKDTLDRSTNEQLDQTNPIGSLNDGSTLESALNYYLVARIDIDSFATYMYPDELDRAFSLPRICPAYEQISDEQSSTQATQRSTSDQDKFPTFEEIFGKEPSYRISSLWSIEFARPFNLIEHLHFDKNLQDTPTGKIDGWPTSDGRNWVYYVLYNRDMIFRYDGETCEAIQSAENTLQTFSSRLPGYNYAGKVRHYGLGGLWQLASDGGNSVDYLGQHFSGPHASMHRIWRIKLVNELEADFSFSLVQVESANDLKLSLHSVIIRDDHRVLITVSNIDVGPCVAPDVSVPSTCDTGPTKLSMISVSEFQTFEQRFSGPLGKTRFKILYDVTMSSEDGVQFVRGLESSQGDGNCVINLWGGPHELELWSILDTNSLTRTLMFQPRSKRCVKSESPSNILGLSGLFKDLDDKVDPQYNEAFLLANIWKIFGDRIAQNKDNHPTRKEILRESRKLHLYEWIIKNSVAEVSFEFEEDKDATNSSITLRTVVIKSAQLSSRSIRFAVTYLSTSLFDHKLPQECQVTLNSNQRGPELKAAFGDRVFHMQSRIIQNSENYNIDEWLEVGKSYRLAVSAVANHGRQPIEDYLLYNETRESFNLTLQNECTQLFDLTQRSDNWLNPNVIRLNQEIGLYGPLFFWSLIEDPKFKVSPKMEEQKPHHKLFDFDYMSSLFNTEVWLIELDGELGPKVYLRFARDLMAAGEEDAKLILEELKLLDNSCETYRSEVLSFVALTESVLDRDQRHMLLIPKGRGCKRNKMAWTRASEEGLDKFNVHTLGPLTFKYIASSNQIRNNHLVSKPIVQTGWFGECPASWSLETIAGLKVSHWRRYNYNSGTVASYRRVISRIAPRSSDAVIRFLNEKTGFCTISGATHTLDDEEVLVLDFADGQYTEPITIKRSILISFEILDVDFDPIQIYQEEDGSTVAVYEARRARVALNSQLAGPASIVRTFTRTKETSKYRQHYVHSNVKLEILVLNQVHLTLTISDLGFWNCFDLLSETRSRDCHVSSEMEVASGTSGLALNGRLRMIRLIFLPENNRIKPSISEFTTAKSDIVRQLGKMFITDPHPIDPMQLGRVDASFDTKDSSVKALIELIEPLSPMHLFEELPNKVLRRSGQETLLHIRVVESPFACSEWCGSMDDCVAFSYCSDHVCQVLTGVHPGSNNLANSFGIDDIQCTLYHKKTSQTTSMRVSNVLKLLRRYIDGGDYKNKLTFKIFRPDDSSSQYFARKVEALFSDEYSNEPSVMNDQVKFHGLETYALMKTDKTFPLSDFNSPITISFALADRLADCLGACEKLNSPLCSYCGRSHLCSSVANITSWEDLKALEYKFEEDQTNMCTIYSIDYLKSYTRLSATARPARYLAEQKDLSLNECAAMCSLYKASEHDRRSLSECLSFDFCFKDKSDKPTCYVERNHVMIGDSSDLIYANDSDLDCMHFSKSLISDYTPTIGKKFKNHETIHLKGSTIDTCTMICHMDPSCIAFEYCNNRQIYSCYIKRYSDYYEETASSHSADIELIKDPECVVYFLKTTALDVESDVVKRMSSTDEDGSLIQSLLQPNITRLIVVSLCAVVLGFFVQTALDIRTARGNP